MSHFFKTNLSDTIYNLNSKHLSREELDMAVSLQGVTAQKTACIAINIPEDFRNILEEKYGIKIIDTDSVWSLIDKFSDQIQGAAVYEKREDINKASTASAAYGFIAVHKSLLEKIETYGIDLKINASKEYKSEFDAFLKCKEHLNNNYVCHQLPDNPALRDYAVASKSPVYAGNKKEELDQIYSWVRDTGAVLGWYYDEVSGVGTASKYGLMTIPSDHAWNLSVYSGLKAEKQKQKPYAPRKRDSKNVHYVTFLLSDGDNVQVHLNSYRKDNYASRQRGKLPFGWTTSPSLYDLAPLVNEFYYDNETDDDDFLAAVSGVGYCNPALLPENVLYKYAELSSEYMADSDIENTVLLMDTPEEMLIDKNEKSINNLYKITEAFSRGDGIKGGFLYYGYLYCPVKTPGAVFWNNGKPFNAIRETLWNDGDKKEYMKELARKINGHAKDCTRIEGYTAINVQYWQYGFDEVVEFAKMLDDDVVVVTPREFIKLMTENISDKTDKLYLED